jgi:hypothetical protein
VRRVVRRAEGGGGGRGGAWCGGWWWSWRWRCWGAGGGGGRAGGREDACGHVRIQACVQERGHGPAGWGGRAPGSWAGSPLRGSPATGTGVECEMWNEGTVESRHMAFAYFYYNFGQHGSEAQIAGQLNEYFRPKRGAFGPTTGQNILNRKKVGRARTWKLGR